MSDQNNYGDDEDDEDEDEEGEANVENEEGKVQRKLHLFQCASVQQSIKRLWDLLPKDDNNLLAMEGYVELNLRLQKALTQEFVLERAIDSAIGDWAEDVREGQRSMAGDEFAMFLFELCSLWCGPSVSLLVYLLFLNAVYIAVTDARGAHTIGLRPLMAVERLPQPFFDLLSVQGWARQPEENARLDADQALSSWLMRNLSPESEEATRVQVQRQVFQVTHDVRSVLLFQEGTGNGDVDILGLVKLASQNLTNISPIEARSLLTTAAGAPYTGKLALPELHNRPWCPPTHGKPPPPGPRPPNPQSPLQQQVVSGKSPIQQRSRSQPSGKKSSHLAHILALGDGEPPHVETRATPKLGSQPPPRGRLFDTKLAKSDTNGLVLVGQMTTSGQARPLANVEMEVSTSKKHSFDSWIGSQIMGTCSTPASFKQGVGSPPPGTSMQASHPPNVSPISAAVGRPASRSSPAIQKVDTEIPEWFALLADVEKDNLQAFFAQAAKHDKAWTQEAKYDAVTKFGLAPERVEELRQYFDDSHWASFESQGQVASVAVAPAIVSGTSKRSAGSSPSRRAFAGMSAMVEVGGALGVEWAEDAKTQKEVQGQVFKALPPAADSFLVDTPWSAPYRLPKKPQDLYQKQINALTKIQPQSVVWNANKWQSDFPLVQRPFDRVLRKLPADCRPSSPGPVGGPMHHPNEPIWFEMTHRLQGILKRQGRRAERRRKRRLRSKLFRGRSKHAPQKREDGRELREYFDRARAERHESPSQGQAGNERPGEFLSKVHERYLIHRERAESRPFRLKGIDTTSARTNSIGAVVKPKHHTVRPVYVPPPPSSMQGRPLMFGSR